MITRDRQLEAKIVAAMKRDGGKQSVDEIAGQLAKRPPNVYAVLRRLEERGEAQRTPGDRGGENPQLWFIPKGLPLREIRRASLAKEKVVYAGALEIESGIPIPPERRNAQTGFAEALRKMKVGDSVLIRAARGGHRYGMARELGIKIVTRKLDNGQVRIWRVK